MDFWRNPYSLYIALITLIVYVGVHVVVTWKLPYKGTKKVWMAWILVIAEIIIFALLIRFNNMRVHACEYRLPLNPDLPDPSVFYDDPRCGLIPPYLVLLGMFDIVVVSIAGITSQLIPKRKGK